ncbi:hypothetical protein Tco_0047322 [Tanacetum coccineum]
MMQKKAELKACLEIVPDDDSAVNVESLATKYPIVDKNTHILAEDKMYYQIIRADGSAKFYKIFSAILDDFDKQDVLHLYMLVKERFETTSPEGYDRLLWGDLITLFEPSEEDKIWKAQQDYTLISWRLYDSYGVHLLLMDTVITIHMMVEKKYPLTQEMLSRMLSGKLEVDHECEMAYELLRFIKINKSEIERLLRAVVSQEIVFVAHNSVIDTSHLQTELEHTLDPLPQKLENENVKLEFQVWNYEKENAHLKITYKNLFDSINVTRAQTKTIIDSLQTKLHDTIDENAKLRAQLFDKASKQKDPTKDKSPEECSISILSSSLSSSDFESSG